MSLASTVSRPSIALVSAAASSSRSLRAAPRAAVAAVVPSRRRERAIESLSAAAAASRAWMIRAAAAPSPSFGRRRSSATIARAGLVEQLDADGLEAAIASRDRPLIIDFFATWCGPCVLMAKELEAVAAELGDKVKIVKVDVDANEAIASSLSIQGLPTLVFVGTEPGKPALRTEGLLPAATIKEIIANEL